MLYMLDKGCSTELCLKLVYLRSDFNKTFWDLFVKFVSIGLPFKMTNMMCFLSF